MLPWVCVVRAACVYVCTCVRVRVWCVVRYRQHRSLNAACIHARAPRAVHTHAQAANDLIVEWLTGTYKWWGALLVRLLYARRTRAKREHLRRYGIHPCGCFGLDWDVSKYAA